MKGALRFLVVVLMTSAAGSAFAASFDVGDLLSNSTGVQGSVSGSPSLVQNDLAQLWMQAAFGDSIILNGQLGLTYANAQTGFGNALSPQVLAVDLNTLNLQATFPQPQPGVSLYQYTLGRATVSDFSALVLSQNADGLSMTFGFPVASLNVAMAYTGLLLKPSTTIVLSRADAADSVNPAVLFAPPRLLEALQLTFPAVFGQRIILQAIAQEDMRGTVLDLATPAKTSEIVKLGQTTQDPTLGGPVSTQYFGLELDGPIVGALYYDAYGYLQTGQFLQYTDGSYQQAGQLAYLASIGLRYYAPDLLFSAVGAKLLFASGDASATTVVEGKAAGTSSAFTPITNATIAYVFSPQLTNIAYGEVSYSLKPLTAIRAALADSLQTQVVADVFLRPTPGATSAPGIVAGNTDLYLGTEVDLVVTARPVSDIGLTLTAGVFMPGSAFGAAPAIQYKTGLEVSISI
ncbi:MAG TPA: alginate export family protein [Spirochaetia bacterium]|nr:alginate export family protein [Spirochaetia bacterium]